MRWWRQGVGLTEWHTLHAYCSTVIKHSNKMYYICAFIDIVSLDSMSLRCVRCYLTTFFRVQRLASETPPTAHTSLSSLPPHTCSGPRCPPRNNNGNGPRCPTNLYVEATLMRMYTFVVPSRRQPRAPYTSRSTGE